MSERTQASCSERPQWHDTLLDRDRDDFWRPRWQGLARLAIVAGLVLFASLLFVAIRERGEPVAARGIDRADPEAVIESTGSELVQSAGSVENFILEATRQLTYPDGSIRFVGGVELTVSEQENRDGFTVTGAEASVNEAQSAFEVVGGVQLTSSDGLVAHTDTATYAHQQNQVAMHDASGPTTLSRSGLEASGGAVTYDRSRRLITLRDAAAVRLVSDDTRAAVDIASPRATLAEADGYMHFEGGTEVRTGTMVMESDDTMAHFGEERTALESLELRGGARIRSSEADVGGLREMRADETTLAFEETTRILEQATLAGGAAIELAGPDGQRGSRIDAARMDVTMVPGGRTVMTLEAGGDVHLRLADTPGEPQQEIRAGTLTGSGTPDIGLSAVRFDRGVEYRERRRTTAANTAATRVVRADRLEAGVDPGLSSLLKVEFRGNVRFEDETRRGEADEAAYDVTAGVMTLGSAGAAGQTPRLIDATSTIEAPRLEVALDGSTVVASGGVKSVLTSETGDATEAIADKMPTLLAQDQKVNVAADGLQYDGDAGLATYSGQARLWQGVTSFRGDTIAMNSRTGGLSVTGAAKTTIQLIRVDDTTQSREVSKTDAEADTFLYDDALRYALYDANAILRSEFGDLKADTIGVFLEADGRTLDRFEATGNVTLRLDTRWATGDRLVYYEAEGRYEMEGAPVEIVEEVWPEEPAATTPPPRPNAKPAAPTCRTTTGRALTFYRATDTVAVDGREQLRTETSNGQCQAPQPF